MRREIELALKSGDHVIPFLLGSPHEVVAPLPEELPAGIALLISR